jgi:CheY-like chemotaxis protein
MPKTVMIVEDNELNMKLFHDLLEAYGYRTIGTRNGLEVLDLARKGPSRFDPDGHSAYHFRLPLKTASSPAPTR